MPSDNLLNLPFFLIKLQVEKMDKTRIKIPLVAIIGNLVNKKLSQMN
jgi:hypothetical protein